MRQRVEAVVARAHVDRVVSEPLPRGCRARHEVLARSVVRLRPRRKPDEREIHRATAAVAGLRRDVALLEHDALVHVRVELGLHRLVTHALAPAHEVVHRPLRAVAVVDLQRIPTREHPVLHAGERLRRRTREDAQRLPVALDRAPDEVVRGVVADVHQDRRRDVVEGHEAGRRLWRCDGGPRRAEQCGHGEEQHHGTAHGVVLPPFPADDPSRTSSSLPTSATAGRHSSSPRGTTSGALGAVRPAGEELGAFDLGTRARSRREAWNPEADAQWLTHVARRHPPSARVVFGMTSVVWGRVGWEGSQGWDLRGASPGTPILRVSPAAPARALPFLARRGQQVAPLQDRGSTVTCRADALAHPGRGRRGGDRPARARARTPSAPDRRRAALAEHGHGRHPRARRGCPDRAVPRRRCAATATSSRCSSSTTAPPTRLPRSRAPAARGCSPGRRCRGAGSASRGRCSRGSRRRAATIVVSLDADTRPRPGLVSALARRSRTRTSSPPARASRATRRASAALHPGVPGDARLPLRAVRRARRPPRAARAIANGQCTAVRRTALLAAGGYARGRGHMTDDAALARGARRATGWRVAFRDAAELIEVDMHESAREVWREWGRSIALPDVTTAAWAGGGSRRRWLTLALPPLRLLARRAGPLDASLLAVRLALLRRRCAALRASRRRVLALAAGRPAGGAAAHVVGAAPGAARGGAGTTALAAGTAAR